MVKFKLTRRQVVRQAAGLLFTLTPIASALAKAAPPAQFVAARIWPSHAYTRITIESSRALQYQHFALENPGRLVIDIQNANINSVLQGISGKVLPDDPYIRSIRAGQNTPTTVRVVIDLKQNAYPQVFSLAPVGGFKNRLVIDLYPHGVDANDPMMALLNGNPPKRMQTQRPAERTDIAQDVPPRSNRGGRRPVVMIDPGHGGEDPGAIGSSGLKEKNVVLSIARETKNRLESIGYTVYMTRNEDIFIPLGVRVAKARAREGINIGGVVGTVMTNMAMEIALKEQGVDFCRAKVGDRYVLEQLNQRSWLIGGEASGHILCMDKHNTGDGIISALQVLAALQILNQDLATVCADWQPYPQTMINVRIQKGQKWQEASKDVLAEVEKELEGKGRVVLRASGTEPVVRVMVEARQADWAREGAERIASAIGSI